MIKFNDDFGMDNTIHVLHKGEPGLIHLSCHMRGRLDEGFTFTVYYSLRIKMTRCSSCGNIDVPTEIYTKAKLLNLIRSGS